MGEKRGMKALEMWCKRVTDGYQGVKVENMTTSWRDGLAFCAIIHHFRPELIDFGSLNKADIYRNNELAFRTAEHHLGIPALLDAEDMVEFSVPDRLSILTYLSQFYQTFAGSRQSTSPSLNRTLPLGKRSSSPSVSASSSQSTPSKMPALGPRREPCAKCNMPVFIAERLLVGGRKLFHRTCFRCARCHHQLSLANCYETEDGQYCCEACPDEVDTKSVVPEAAKGDTPGAGFETVLESSLTDHPISCVEVKQDVQSKAMSNFMIGQLQCTDEEVPSPHPPNSSMGTLSDTTTQTCILDSEINSHVNSASVSLETRNSDISCNVDDAAIKKDDYFFIKTNSPQVATAGEVGEEVPFIESSIKHSDSNEPLTANDAREDCTHDQNELITKCTKESDAAPTSLVKMRMRMFNNDQQEETQKINYTSRKSINLYSKSEENMEESDAVIIKDLNLVTPREIDQLHDNEPNELIMRTTSVEENKDILGLTCEQDKLVISHDNITSNNEDDIILEHVGEAELQEKEIIKSTSSTDVILKESSVSAPDEESTRLILEDVKNTSCNNYTNANLNDDSICAVEESTDSVVSTTVNNDNHTSREPVSTTESPRKDSNIVYPTKLNPFGDTESDEDEEPATLPVPSTKSSTNPFGSDEEDEMPNAISMPTSEPPRPPPPAARPSLNQHVTEIPKISVNPFWSDGEEPVSDDESKFTKTPVPRPRTVVHMSTPEPSPMPRLRGSSDMFGSSNSLSSDSSRSSTMRRKKKHAPAPPLPVSAPPLPDSTTVRANNEEISSPNHSTASSPKTLPRHRKTRPAPPPPSDTAISQNQSTRQLKKVLVSPAIECEKLEKDEANRNRQSKLSDSLSGESPFMVAANKSMYGQWKRKKGPAPPRPVPQRREIRAMPMKDVKRELDDIDVQQLELERQGVSLEKTIRSKCEDTLPMEDSTAGITLDVEDLVLQLFEIVNEKNELFRRQAELMYLRRQHRLEEEHADLEYEIRCLLDRPDHTKTDTEKAYEEDLISRLVDVVERRNEIVNCLEMNRQREAEEDRSIQEHLVTFTAKGKKGDNIDDELEAAGASPQKKTQTLKLLKKKPKKNKEKLIKKKDTTNIDADKDIDESDNLGKVKEKKTKRKWF